jgi:autotransporter-associated beta strand protein
VVNIATTVSPAAVTFNNNSAIYLFTGSGGITGPAQLNKSGTGKVALANSGVNDYTGGTVVNAGTLQIGDDVGAAGGSVGPGPVTTATAGRFVINRQDSFIFGNALAGSGTFVKDGPGTITLNNGDSAGFFGDFVVEEGVLRITTRRREPAPRRGLRRGVGNSGTGGGTFLGTPVDADSILIRHTIKGDANLNGTVSFQDLVALAQNDNRTGDIAWNKGDFT